MKLLLDTHAALWWWNEPSRLGTFARNAMADPTLEILFSAASAYEIAQKRRLGKLQLPPELHGNGLINATIAEGWRLLPLTPEEASKAASFDHLNRDPFDRMLWAQADLGKLSLASIDPFFQNLGIDLIW